MMKNFSKNNFFIFLLVIFAYDIFFIVINFYWYINDRFEHIYKNNYLINQLYNKNVVFSFEDILYLKNQTIRYFNNQDGIKYNKMLVDSFAKRRGIYNKIVLFGEDNVYIKWTNGTIIETEEENTNIENGKSEEKKENKTEKDLNVKKLTDEYRTDIINKINDNEIFISRIYDKEGKSYISFYVLAIANKFRYLIQVEVKMENYFDFIYENERFNNTFFGISTNDDFWVIKNQGNNTANLKELNKKLFENISRRKKGLVFCISGLKNYNSFIMLDGKKYIKINNVLSSNITYENVNPIEFYYINNYSYLAILKDLIVFILLFLLIHFIIFFIYIILVKKFRQLEDARNNIINRLELTETTYKNIFNFIENPIIKTDKNEVIEYVNNQFETMTGLKKKDLVGKTIKELFLKDFDLSKPFEVTIKNKNSGSSLFILLNPNKIYIGEEYFGTVYIINDLTGIKKDHERLIENSYIFENNPGLVFWFDSYGNIKKTNKNGAIFIDSYSGKNNIFSIVRELNNIGLNESDSTFEDFILGKFYNFSMKYDKDTNSYFLYGLDISKQKELEFKIIEANKLNNKLLESIPYVIRIIDDKNNELYKKDSEDMPFYYNEFWENIRKKDYYSENFNYLIDDSIIPDKYYEIYQKEIEFDSKMCKLQIIKDITISKKNEKFLQLFQIGIEQSATPILFSDINGKIIYVNKAFEKLTGYSYNDVVGLYTKILNSGLHNNEFYENMWKTILSGKVWSGEIYNKRKDGSKYWEKMVITPIKDPAGNLTNFIAIKDDITKKRLIEESLIKAKEIAEKDSVLKSEFIANISHEIRTPLNAIIGFTDILLDEIKDQNVLEKLLVIKNSGENLLDIINDILDLSKLEAGKVVIEKDKFSLGKMLEYVYKIFYERAKSKNIDFFLEIDEKLKKAICFGDEKHILQILNNLVSNAIKFTNYGSVIVKVSYREENLIFDVIDTGIGIPENSLDKIFLPFEQINNKLQNKSSGTGLGLAISKKLAELMGGVIMVESKINSGSKFSFIAPIPVIENVEASKEYNFIDKWLKLWENDEKIKNLVVKSVISLKDNINILYELSSKYLWKDMERKTHEFKGVYGNLGMFEVYEIFSSLNEYLKNIGEQVDVNMVKFYLDKLDRINSMIDYSKIPEYNKQDSEINFDSSKFKILLAEDNPVNQKLTKILIEKLGLTCDIVENGEQVIEKLKDNSYNLLLLDMQMPVMDGVEVLNKLDSQRRKSLYIIALTANALKGDKEKYLEYGCDDYISKPIIFEEFKEKINKAYNLFIEKSDDFGKFSFEERVIKDLKNVLDILKENLTIFKTSKILEAYEIIKDLDLKKYEFVKEHIKYAYENYDEEKLALAVNFLEEILNN